MFNKQVYLRIENSLHTVYIVWINNSSHIQPLSKVKKKKSLHAKACTSLYLVCQLEFIYK